MDLGSDFSMLHTWAGHCYFCQGEVTFPCWWHQDRKPGGCIRHGEYLMEAKVSDWSVAVYVKTQLSDIEGLWDDYMHYICGQNKNYCARHDVPLIAAVGMRKTECAFIFVASGDAEMYMPYPKACLCGKQSLLCYLSCPRLQHWHL